MGHSKKYWDIIGLDINEKINLYFKIIGLKNQYKNINIVPSDFVEYLNLVNNEKLKCKNIIEEVLIKEDGQINICNPIDKFIISEKINNHYSNLLRINYLKTSKIINCPYCNNNINCYK